MAPSATEPRQLLVVLNTARRRALYNLSSDIVTHMRAQLELKDGNDSSEDIDSESWSDDDTLYDGQTGNGGGNFRRAQAPPPLPSQGLVELRSAAVEHLNQWAQHLLDGLKKIVVEPDTPAVVEERRKRLQKLANTPAPAFNDNELIGFEDDSSSTSGSHSGLGSLYKPISNRVATLSFHDRRDCLSCLLLLLLSDGRYSAHSRVFALYLCSSLKLPVSVLIAEETEIAKSLLQASSSSSSSSSSDAGRQNPGMSAEAEARKRRQEGQASRFWKVGLASVAGAAVIGITGGLAAPVVAGAIGGLMGSVGLGGVASFLGVFWMNGALVGTLFGAFGAKMTGEMMDKYAKEVEDFRFIPLRDSSVPRANGQAQDDQTRRLRVTIGINGWLTSNEDITKPWSGLSDDTEVFALRYEMDKLLQLGNALKDLVSSYAWKTIKVEILRRTVLATLWAALWPAYVLSVAANVDNPFNLASNRSEKAGRVLADALINRVQGERPVTLVGYSLGARAIYTCLRTLAERKAFGLIDDVVLIGAPAPSDAARWRKLRSVVAGRIFNVYSENDYILGFLYRTHSLQFGVAGLQPLKSVGGVQNLDLSAEVSGHLRYPLLISQILARCGFADVRGGDNPIEREEDLNEVGAAGPVAGAGTSGADDLGLLIQLDDPVAEPKALATSPNSSRSAFGDLAILAGNSSSSASTTTVRTNNSQQLTSDDFFAQFANPAPPPRKSNTAHVFGRPTNPAPTPATARRDNARDSGTDNNLPGRLADPSRTIGAPKRSATLPLRQASAAAAAATTTATPNRPAGASSLVATGEPKSLATSAPRPARRCDTLPLPVFDSNPLHQSYASTLAVHDGASDEESGEIRMVSYDSD